MRIASRQPRSEGSVLMIGLVIMLLLGMGLISYMSLVRTQSVSVARSQAWNAALVVAEAGVEEALAQLNPSLNDTNINRAANGWSYSGGVFQAPQRSLREGYYDVQLTADAYPVIYSTGYVAIPYQGQVLKRTVKVTTTAGFLISYGLTALTDVDMSGFRVETDSFDSTDDSGSTGGLYDATKRRDNGDVVAISGMINVGNAKINGSLWTGPEGKFDVGPQGSIGDLAWVASSKGAQEDHYRNDFNMDFPDVTVPFTTGLTPKDLVVDGTNFIWSLQTADYYFAGDAKIKTGEHILVSGKARIFVTGDFIMLGSSSIIISPGGSLDIYVGGQQAVFSTVNNEGNCSTLTYWGLPSNTSVSFGGNDTLLGVIYAPQATLTLGGGGHDYLDFQGGCVVNNIKMNGHINYHYDEGLRKKGPLRGFVATSWTEL